MTEFSDYQLLNRAQVENYFGIPVRFLETAVMSGDGPPIVRLGRSVRYRFGDVKIWIDAQVDGGQK